MTDRDNDQGWIADPQITDWLGENTTPAASEAAAAEPPLTQSDSDEPATWSPDSTVWAQNSAVSGWLASPPADGNDGPRTDPRPIAAAASDLAYDAQITAPMAPIAPASAPASNLGGTAAVGGVDPQRPQRGRRRPNRRTMTMAGAVAVAVGVVLGLIITVASFVGKASDDEPVAQPPAPSAPILPPPVSPAEDADCPNRTDDNGVITGRDPGGTSSGPAVIKAFEHAYFVQRSGAQARSFVAPLGRAPTAEQIQTGIDSALAPGTRHCVAITSRGDGLWGVEVTMLPPGAGEPETSRQLFQTAEVEGRTLITAITKDTNQ